MYSPPGGLRRKKGGCKERREAVLLAIHELMLAIHELMMQRRWAQTQTIRCWPTWSVVGRCVSVKQCSWALPIGQEAELLDFKRCCCRRWVLNRFFFLVDLLLMRWSEDVERLKNKTKNYNYFCRKRIINKVYNCHCVGLIQMIILLID